MSSALGTTNRGGKFGYYYVTRDPQFASTLIETGFLSNEREYRKLIDEEYQAQIASGHRRRSGFLSPVHGLWLGDRHPDKRRCLIGGQLGQQLRRGRGGHRGEPQ